MRADLISKLFFDRKPQNLYLNRDEGDKGDEILKPETWFFVLNPKDISLGFCRYPLHPLHPC
jgi:hypothetical protein